jgi:MFS transporter, SP family, arabinose:H+ symporter
LGITVSIALWGTVAGCAFSGVLGQRLGGRAALRIMAVLYILSALGCAFAWNWPVLLVARFIGGLGIGGSSVLGPVYIAEVAPAKWRGRLVGIFQINIVLGILAAYLSNYIISSLNIGMREWRWEFGIALFPAVLFLVMLFTIPQSPRWLAVQGDFADALDGLRKLGSENPEGELAAIKDSLGSTGQEHDVPLFQRKWALPIFLAASIGFFNQMAGVNAILYYATDIFRYAGFSRLSGNLQSVLIGLMNLVGTFIGMSLIDKAGRKTLLLVGSVGTGFCLAGVAAIFLTHSHAELLVWFLMAFICFFAASQGAVIWVYIAEVFPTQVRSKGQSLGSGSHWIMNALIALVFPIMAQRSNGAPFVLFSAMMLVQLIVVWRFYPETKGHTLEELQIHMQQSRAAVTK